MITSVKLKNWKSHRETELAFGDGTNVLVGIMGSGKSSVMEGITYALFGTLPAAQSRRIKLDDLISNRPQPLDSAEVEVKFQSPDGDDFVVRRVIERGSGTTLSELRKGSGELIEGPNASRVTEAIKSILDLDYDLFERAVYSEQNRLDYFLTLQRGKRMENIDELLGINKLEKARKGIGSMANRITERAGEREIAARNLRQDDSLSRLSEYERELAELATTRQQTGAGLEKLRTELGAIRAQDQRFRELERELRELEQSERGLEGTIATLRRNIDEVRKRLGAKAGSSLEKVRGETKGLESAHATNASTLNKLQSGLTKATSSLQGLEMKKSMLTASVGKLSADLERRREAKRRLDQMDPRRLAEDAERAQAELRGCGDRLAGHRVRIADINKSIEELMTAGASCPVCDAPLEEERKKELLAKRRRELKELAGEVEAAEVESSKLGAKLRTAQELHRKALMLEKDAEGLTKLDAELADVYRQLACLDDDIPKQRRLAEELTATLEQAKAKADELSEQLARARQLLQDRADLEARSAELDQKLGELQRTQARVERIRQTYDESKAEAVRSRVEELVGAQERLQAEYLGKEQLIAEKRKVVDGVREKLALIRRYEAESRRLREAAQAMATIQTALARTQTAMRKMFIEGVNLVMNDLWESIYPYGDFSGVRLEVEEGERGDYVLQLRDRSGNWIPVDGIASGGERTDAALALRISFSMVLAPKLKWIVFDEPTHNLDAEGIQELAKVMRERLPEFVKQILLITHEERLESAVSGYLYRFARDKRQDEPTRVERVTAPELYD